MDADKQREILAGFEKARMEQFYQDARCRLQVVADTGFLFIKSMLILSGGSVVILLALLKPGGSVSVVNPLALWVSFGCFGGSALLTIISLFIAYLGQDEFQQAEMDTAKHVYESATGKPNPKAFPQASWDKGAKISLGAIWVAGFAVVAFAGGLASALLAMAISGSA